MTGKNRFSRWFLGIAILAVAECATVAAIELALIVPAEAQRADDRYRRSRGGGFFQQLFGPFNQRQIEVEQQAPADYSRAPSQRKPEPRAEPVEPTTSIVVMGDGMADWLASGLEDAFSDSPEIAIIRKSKSHSGLLRYDARSDLDWWHAARDILSAEKPNYVIMMLGVSDRQNIREKDLIKDAERNKDKNQADKVAGAKAGDDKTAQKADQADDADSRAIIAPEPQPSKKSNGILEFRSDEWEKVYSRRIDQTVAALKSKGVPVFWVGLPSIRGTRSTADVVYLNDLYRAGAERAGAVYIDVWDGFIDEGGKFTSSGPDFEGQVRRLRTGDGVFFTKYGARKLAHYAERELRRFMSNRSLQISLPSGPMGPVPSDGKSAVRPLAGPVMPLTMTTGNSGELLGGAGSSAERGDATATGVLVKGDAVTAPSGRADDFIWPRGSVAAAPPVAAKPADAASASAAVPANGTATPAAVVAKPEPAFAAPVPVIANPGPAVTSPEPAQPDPVAATDKKPAELKSDPKSAPKREVRTEPAARTTQNAAAKPVPPRPIENRPRRQQTVAPRPQQPLRQRNDGLFGTNGPFGWMR